MAKPVVDLTELSAALVDLMGEASDLTPLMEGEESRAVRFTSRGERFVARVNRSRVGFDKDAFAVRFSHPAAPVPEVLHVGDFADGLALCISRLVPGVTLQDLPAVRLPAYLAPTAAAMRAIGESEIGDLAGYGPWTAAGTALFASWRAFLLHITNHAAFDWSRVGDHVGLERIERLLARLSELAASCPERRGLIHGDFGSNNVAVHADRVTAVIDWSEAMFGDPLYDLANIFFWRTWLPCMEQQVQWFETHLVDFDRITPRLHCYALRIGLQQVYDAALAGDVTGGRWALARCESIEQ